MQQQLQRAFQMLQQGQHPQAERVSGVFLSQFPQPARCPEPDGPDEQRRPG